MAAKDGILAWIGSEKPRSKTGDGINIDMKIMTSGDAIQIDVNSSILTGKAFKIYDDNGSADLFTVDKGGNVVGAGKATVSAASITNNITAGSVSTAGLAAASSVEWNKQTIVSNAGGASVGYLPVYVSGVYRKIKYFASA